MVVVGEEDLVGDHRGEDHDLVVEQLPVPNAVVQVEGVLEAAVEWFDGDFSTTIELPAADRLGELPSRVAEPSMALTLQRLARA